MATLFILASPIGNLEDISLRALRILKETCNVIFCEDTRVSSKLLNFYEIKDKKLLSCHKENEKQRSLEILDYLNSGEDLAYISDAGTPSVSDPGLLIIQKIQSTNHKVVPLPGASALTCAISSCHLDCSRFVFEGFLPHGPKQRRRVLRNLVAESRAIIFFESPHRLIKTLLDLEAIMPERAKDIFLARELTKKFEEFYRGPISSILKKLEEEFGEEIKGEFVLILGACPKHS
jgi:16S rRNA (cytidine1402-2'-O)-methyltransferase